MSERAAVLKSFKPYFDYDSSTIGAIAQQASKSVSDYVGHKNQQQNFPFRLSSLRNINLSNAEQEALLNRLVVEGFKFVYGKGVVSISDASRFFANRKGDTPVVILHHDIAEETISGELFTPKMALEYLVKKLASSFFRTEDQSLAFVSEAGLERVIIPNVKFDEDKTAKVKSELLSSVSLSSGMVQAGERIVSKGDIVDANTYLILESLKHGASTIIPVAEVEEALRLKMQGFLVAAERDGKVLDFADFGNSPFNFKREVVEGRSIVYSTTNGTKAIQMASIGKEVIVSSFLNLSATAAYLGAHVRNTNANVEPVFFSYPAVKEVDQIVENVVKNNKPVYDYVSPDGFGHHFWIIADDATNRRITEIFKQVPALYVADGHHRTAAAALVGNEKKMANKNHTGNEEYNFFLAVIFPDNQLKIIDYNRVVKDLNGHTPAQLIDKLSVDFDVKVMGPEIYKPSKLHNFSMVSRLVNEPVSLRLSRFLMTSSSVPLKMLVFCVLVLFDSFSIIN